MTYIVKCCSSRISIVTGICSVATFATFIGLPVSTVLGATTCLTGVIASGIVSTLTKKYKKKLKKVTKLIDIVAPGLVIFERVVSGALKNGVGPKGPRSVQSMRKCSTCFRCYTLKHLTN